jgi:hypothetical protein
MQGIQNFVLHHGYLKSLLHQVIGLLTANLSLVNSLCDEGDFDSERLRNQCHLILVLPEYVNRPTWDLGRKSEQVQEHLIRLSAGLGYSFLNLWLNCSFVRTYFLSERKRHGNQQQSH